jgi:hypothetical protein
MSLELLWSIEREFRQGVKQRGMQQFGHRGRLARVSRKLQWSWWYQKRCRRVLRFSEKKFSWERRRENIETCCIALNWSVKLIHPSWAEFCTLVDDVIRERWN